MAQQLIPAGPTHEASACSPRSRVTKSLLGYGVIAGPFFVAVSLAQALTREGFDLGRHQWSLLENGGLGWVQIANFVLSGLMVIAFSVGLRRALSNGLAGTWGPRLLAVYGASLVAAGAFRADPALGFPAGTPEGPGTVSWHGMLHFLAGGIGFFALAAACFVLGRRYSALARPEWARSSRATGVVFLAGFAMVASSGGSVAGTIAFSAAVILIWAWLSSVAADTYRRVSD